MKMTRISAIEKRLAAAEFVKVQPLASPELSIAIYTRVSTDRQEAENQAVQLHRFARKQGWKIVNEYCNHESGGKCNRAEFQRMFADARKRRFELILFWAMGRFSREGVLPTQRYLETLRATASNGAVSRSNFSTPASRSAMRSSRLWRRSQNRNASGFPNAQRRVWRLHAQEARHWDDHAARSTFGRFGDFAGVGIRGARSRVHCV